MTYSRQDIDALIASRSRELSSQEREVIVLAKSQEKPQDFAYFSGCEREVYKDLKSKRANNISRSSEESDRTCPSDSLGGRTSFLEVSPEGLEGQGSGVMLSAPASISSRSLSGITAQHQKTKKGIKVMLTLQQADEAEYCAYIEVTAELKRSNRISELKPYAGDSEQFAAFYAAAKQAIKDEEDIEHRRKICIGRLHERGQRSSWIADMLVIGYLKEDETLDNIIYYYGGEEYKIKMDHMMSSRQSELYHSNGLYGNLIRQRTVPTLATLKRKHF